MYFLYWLQNLKTQIVSSALKHRVTKIFEHAERQYENNQFRKSLLSWEKALSLYQRIGDTEGEADSLGNIGMIYQTLGHYQQAQEYLEQPLIITRKIGYTVREVLVLGNLSNVHQVLGQNKQAVDYLKQALTLARRLEVPSWEANALRSLGKIYRDFGEHEKALNYLNRSLAITQEINDQIGEVDTQGNLGISYRILGQYQRASECFVQSLSISRLINYFRGEAYSLRSLGDIHQDVGQYKKALDFFEQALTISQVIEDFVGVVACLDGLGRAYQYLGQYQQAIEYHQKALTSSQSSGFREGELIALSNLGIVYDTLGQYQKSLEYHQQSLTTSRELEYPQQESEALGNLGNVHQSLGQYSTAVEQHQQSLAIAHTIGDRKGEAASLINLGIAYHCLEQYQEAISCYQQAINTARAIGDRQQEANALGGLGNAYDELKEHPRAIEYHQQYLSIAREIGDAQGEAAALSNLSDTLFQMSKFNEAEDALNKAIKAWENLRAELVNDLDKVSIFDTQNAAYNLLQQVYVAQNQPIKALEIAERGRARAFAELLLRKNITVDSKNLRFHTEESLIDIERIKQVAQSQGITLVEYSIVDMSNHLLIWVIQPTGKAILRQVDLRSLKENGTTLSEIVFQARQSLGLNEEKQSELFSQESKVVSTCSLEFKGLRKLYELLIQPIADLLPDSQMTVAFIPQKELFLVPFSALQDSGNSFLIEKYPTSVFPSIQVMELIQRRKQDLKEHLQRPGSKDIEGLVDALVVGNPVMPIIPLTDPPKVLPSLPWTTTEAEAIARLLGIRPITGASATKLYVKEQMPKARFIHLATHGLLDDVRQLGIPGAIALTPSGEDSGFLTAGEILEMQLNAQLVVLSACSSGQGKITGDGVIGLSRSLIAAGVSNVIVSLWSVDDQSTAFLMIEFYQGIREGMTAVTALNTAQRWLMNITKSEMESWAKVNETSLASTLRLYLRRKLNQLSAQERPFYNPRHWAAFYVIGQT